MKNHLAKIGLLVAPALFGSALSVSLAVAQGIDRDGDGAGDFWQNAFGLTTLNLGEDNDADGVSNQAEEAAGTDPNDPRSFFRIGALSISAESENPRHARLTFEAVAGKAYQLQESGTLDPESWIAAGKAIVAKNSGTLSEEVVLAEPLGKSFYRVLVSDVDGDRDGLTAYAEAMVGTSDENPNTGNDPRGGDLLRGMDWLSKTDPGADPEGTSDNLREVDVAWIQQPDGSDAPALLVTVVGSGGWHQLTEWKVPSSGVPAEVATTRPIDGHHPKIINLEPGPSLPATPKKFVTGRIRDNGDLWLSSRAGSTGNGFVHFDSVGYGSNANVDVLDYAFAERAITSFGLVVRYQIVTPVLVRPHGSSTVALRVITWSVEYLTGDLTGLHDSGDLAVYDLPNDANAARIRVAPISSSQFQITYTSQNGSLSHHAIWANGNGIVSHEAIGTSATDIRGTGSVTLSQQANALAGLTSSGYLTAIRETDGGLKMAAWEQREEEPDQFESYLIADHTLDLGPNANGVFLQSPLLTDSWNDEAGAGDHLSEALAVGDFDGDGYDDVAIAAPTRDASGEINSGAVYIIEGDSDGITGQEYQQLWTQASSGIQGVLENGDLFGRSLAAGDFDGDGIDDLAIGAPGEDVGDVSVAGAVHVLYGTPFGLSSAANLIVTQETLGHTSDAFDYFGWSLAAGDFNHNGRDDLAIGILNQTVGGHADAGAVVVMWGTSAGLTTGGSTYLHQDVIATFDQAEDMDEFGRVLAAGDFNGDAFDDLAVGIPREDSGATSNAGAVQVFYGTSTGFGVDVFVTQNGFQGGEDIHGAIEANDFFGESLAVGDFNHDGVDDLVIGVPGEDVGDLADAGAVNVLYGTSLFGLTWGNNLLIQQDQFNPTGGSLPGDSEAGDNFGRSLTTGDFNSDGFDDLIVGAPFEDVGSIQDAGSVFLIFGSNTGLVSTGSRVFHQDSSTIEDGTSYAVDGGSAAGDQFGGTLVSGDFNADGEDDLIVGIPRKDFDEDHVDSGAIQIISGSETYGLTFQTDEEWFARLREVVRAMVTDLAREKTHGVGGGKLYAEGELLEARHVASVTKVMTLLLTVEAIEDGDAAFTDLVPVSDLAGTSGGSKLATYAANGNEITDTNGDEIPFIQPGDTMPLRLLIAAMMNESCNRSSVAIGQHIAKQVKGDPDEFINMMNQRANDLNLNNTVYGHPAGGCVTVPQDLITLLREGSRHPLFLQQAGIEIYGLAPPHNVMCGTDTNGNPKCNGPFAKFNTIGNYPGRVAWKGGNGGSWWGNGEANNVPPQPSVPWCTDSAVGIVERMDRSLAVSVLQSGSDTSDSQQLFDYGFRKIFTPDHRGTVEFPTPGGQVSPAGPVRVRNFAIDRITGTTGVTAVIDDFENLQLNIWTFDPVARAINLAGIATRTYHLQDGASYGAPTLVDMAILPTTAAIDDYFTANLVGEHLELSLWRIGENP